MPATLGSTAFHPLVSEWFAARYGEPTEPQTRGWPLIRTGADVLIAAPTGSGKTLAAFSLCLDDLVRRAAEDCLPERTLVVYVSPLKALTNDVHKNLEIPLQELTMHAIERGMPLAPIRTAVRTGDTTPSERQRMLRKPPHVLVTTPESLFILLTAEKSRQLLSGVSTVVVDEIHAVAGDKRGAHLSLTLARLDTLVECETGRKPQRIGLSATIKPLDEIARFLSPHAQIVHVENRRKPDIAVRIPQDELSSVASKEMWNDVFDQVAELIRGARTTLVFVSTRRMSERTAFALAERLGEGAVLPHHGSLSREARFSAEDRLKKGELRAVVATASLELGIDIGTVDLVVQLGSPRSIGVAIQRIGRSGHWVGAESKARFFATTRDDLLECAALVRAIRAGRLDALTIPRHPLDILAQQVVAACAVHEWEADALYATVRESYSYRDLSRSDFDATLALLSDGITTSRGRSGAMLHYDRVNGRLRPRRGARLAAITSGGAIPDTALYRVVIEPDGRVVGTLDEDFAVESIAGDVFLLGTHSWRILRVEQGVVRAEDAHGAPPSIPFWNGEGLGRTIELSHEVCRLREEIDGCGDAEAIELLERECALDSSGSEQTVAYIRAGKAALGAVPSERVIVAERFFDESGGMQLILHTPFGVRINRAWGLALRKRFCRSFNVELQAAATDNGLLLSLTEQHAFPLEIVFEYVKEATAEYVLTQALLGAPMFGVRWRWNVTRALLVLRMRGGRKTPPQIQRMRSDDLLGSVFPDQVACAENLSGPIRIPDHILVRETIENCLREAMDIDGLLAILHAVENGAIRTAAVDTAEPSPFCHEIVNANPYAFLDDAPLEERRVRAVLMRRTTRDQAGGMGILDPAAIESVASQSWPLIRDADELHDALVTLIVMKPDRAFEQWYEKLKTQRRATLLRVGNVCFWTCAERLAIARLAYPQAVPQPEIPTIAFGAHEFEREEDAFTEIARGYLESSGPATIAEMTEHFAVSAATVEAAMTRLETEGHVLRGRFRPYAATDEFCNRRVLARIHRLTIGQLRREIEPATKGEYLRFLYRWQHVVASSRLHGADGTLHVVRQLEGFEIPAAAWEEQIFPARIAGYKRDYLDRLCYSGEVMWGRLSTHPALEPQDAEKRAAGVRPTKSAPVAFFLREHSGELIVRGSYDDARLSHAARDVLAEIGRRGASFFAEIVRGSKRLPSEVEEGLWQLLAVGLVTADSFDALRSLIDAKRRLGKKGHRARPRSSGGRWTLLCSEAEHIDPEGFARRLLARWGVIFREVVARESLAPPWRELLAVLRRMEAHGEIRGGRFVAAVVGEQYALPEAVKALRAARKIDEEELPAIGAHDPIAGLLSCPLPRA